MGERPMTWNNKMKTRIIATFILILTLCGCAENVELNASNIDSYKNHYVTCNITLTEDLGSYDRQETKTMSTVTPVINSDGHVTMQTVYYTVPVTLTYQIFTSGEGIRVAILRSRMKNISTHSLILVSGYIEKIDEYPGNTLIIK